MKDYLMAKPQDFIPPVPRNIYSPSNDPGFSNDEPSLTKQSSKDECDVNFILKNYEKNGQLPDLIQRDPRYGDFADAKSYQDSLNLVIHAQDQFDALPARTRSRFGNDPEQFLEFVNDPSNNQEMIQMGLATARPTPIEPPVVPQPVVAPAKGVPNA